jgi:hypothetical protein
MNLEFDWAFIVLFEDFIEYLFDYIMKSDSLFEKDNYRRILDLLLF